MGWGALVALFISVLIFYALYRIIRKFAPLILHGLVGIAIFWGLDMAGVIHVPIDLATFLIAAFGGIFGVLIVLAFTYFGIPL